MSTRILVLPGTAEAGAPDHALAFELARRLGVTDATVTILNLADYPLPLLDVGGQAPEPPREAVQLAERIGGVDALVLASPSANGSVPPLAKNAVDWAAAVQQSAGNRPLRAFAGLVVGLASASPGDKGDFPVLAHWRQVFAALGAEVIEGEARVAGAGCFDAQGHLADAEASDRLDAFVAGLGNQARALGRRP